MSNPTIRRIQADIREMRAKSNPFFTATPLEDNQFEWHFTIRGPMGTAFEGGVYHGRILLPPDYPLAPPNIIFLTPNGRFDVNKKICLSITSHHAETWSPAWGIRLICEALVAFLPTKAEGALGALECSDAERRALAHASRSYACPRCGVAAALLPSPSAEVEAGATSPAAAAAPTGPPEEVRCMMSRLRMAAKAGEEDGTSSGGGQAPPTTPALAAPHHTTPAPVPMGNAERTPAAAGGPSTLPTPPLPSVARTVGVAGDVTVSAAAPLAAGVQPHQLQAVRVDGGHNVRRRPTGVAEGDGDAPGAERRGREGAMVGVGHAAIPGPGVVAAAQPAGMEGVGAAPYPLPAWLDQVILVAIALLSVLALLFVMRRMGLWGPGRGDTA